MHYLKKELYSLLRKDDKIFDFIQSASLDGLWYWDVENPEEEWMNDTFWETLGYDPNEMPQKSSAWQNIIFKEDGEEAYQRALEHWADPSVPYDQIVRYKHKKGHTVWVRCRGLAIRNKNGKPIRMIGAHNNVTSLKQHQEELTETKDLLRKSNEAAKIGTWEIDLVTRKPYWSPITRAIHEMPKDYIPTYDQAISFFKDSSQEALGKAVDEAMINGTGYELDLEIITGKGKERWVRTIGTTEIEDGKCVRLYGTFQDIHREKKASLKLKEALETKDAQNKRLLNFAHIVSHNLRSHSGNLSMTLDFLDLEEDQGTREDLLDMLRTSVDKLEETILHLNDVVTVNMSKKEKFTKVCLNDRIDTAIANLKALLISVNGTINNDLPEEVNIQAIPAYVDSILLNFFSNAIKYRHPERAPVIEVSAAKIKNQIVLSISDNGLGIDLKQHQKKLFGMYKTFHGNKDARGIGLFITKNQINAIGGNVEVESQINKGTTFKIYLNEAV